MGLEKSFDEKEQSQKITWQCPFQWASWTQEGQQLKKLYGKNGVKSISRNERWQYIVL